MEHIGKDNVEVSIIIVNYNTKEITLNCIKSIVDNTHGVSYEIILVDNNSSDDSKEFFSSYPGIIYKYLDENVGFGNANNFGFSISKGNYIFLLNSDTILKNDAVTVFHDAYLNAPKDIGFLGTFLQKKDGTYNHSYGILPTIWTDVKFKTFHFVLKKIGYDNFGHDYLKITPCEGNYYEVGYLIGADIYCKRDLILKNGLFDPDFFMYYEDTELQFRFRKLGYKSYIFKGAEIVHLEGMSADSSNKNNLKKKTWMLNSSFKYFKKTTNYSSYITYRILLLLLNLPSIFVYWYPLKDRFNYLKELSK